MFGTSRPPPPPTMPRPCPLYFTVTYFVVHGEIGVRKFAKLAHPAVSKLVWTAGCGIMLLCFYYEKSVFGSAPISAEVWNTVVATTNIELKHYLTDLVEYIATDSCEPLQT
ncbi:hypothetical protein J6590_033544 [Homalodisca vitripennis]|nr:hypothetical protein J6590_033544 [Homalodisca vitripennis]